MYFESAFKLKPMSNPPKKVLIITYHWPPSGNVGVLRCLKWAKYLRNFGWEPIIYTARNAHYPSLDEENQTDIPIGTKVIKGRIIEPYGLYKRFVGLPKNANVNNVFYIRERQPSWAHQLSVWIRSNFFIPDARALWISPSVHYLLKYLRSNPVDAILSDGPPHTNNRIATVLKKQMDIPWLIDFQDPWTQADYYQMLSLTSWADSRHHLLEKEALKLADKTITVSDHWKNDLIKIGASNVSVIHWGYDPEDFAKITPSTAPGFTFTHLGTMGHDRNPQTFLRVLREIGDKNEDFRKVLRLDLVGQVDHSILDSLTLEGMSDRVKILPATCRSDALRLMVASPILLLLLNKQENNLGRIPAKLYEYMAGHRPILVLGPPESDASRIVRKTRSGYTCAYDDENGIREIIMMLYQQYLSGILPKRLDNEIEEYSVYNLTCQLALHLDSLVKRQ
jgi:glycosyltransferase involved in cell wall biosynthesis